MERPLRLNFQASSERIERLREESSFAGLAKSKKKGAPGDREAEQGRELQQQILSALRTLDAEQVLKNRDAFDKKVRATFLKAKLDVPNGVAYFHHGDVSFLLQDFYQEQLAHNLMMHLLVEDVDAWRAHVREAGIAEKYGVKVTDVELRPWKMRDFALVDPSGVLWRIAQNV